MMEKIIDELKLVIDICSLNQWMVEWVMRKIFRWFNHEWKLNDATATVVMTSMWHESDNNYRYQLAAWLLSRISVNPWELISN